MGQDAAHVSRRLLLKTTGAAALGGAIAAGVVPQGDTPRATAPSPSTTHLTPATKLKGTLSILQLVHYVPRYDRWFDAYAQEWGRRVGVNVRVEHVVPETLVQRTLAEIAAGSGHDLIEWIYPPSQLEPDVLDLSDVHDEAVKRFGLQQPFCKKAGYNPSTKKYYGYSHAWVPDQGDYRKSLWQQVGMGDGPSTWEELREGGKAIKQKRNVPVGIGMSNELDSNMAARALMWSYGASVQNELEQVVLNSPETIVAVDYMVRLYREAMTPEVFSWDSHSNNRGLINGKLSYILNPLSAYRTAQAEAPGTAADIFFTPPLRGLTGLGIVSQQPVFVYFVPKFSKNVDAAKEFLLNLSANDAVSTYQSELYNLPAFPAMVPQLDAWLAQDPFGSRPSNKLALLQGAATWTADVGHPGPPNPAEGEVLTRSILPQMMARAAQGKQTVQESVGQADAEVRAIFDTWRRRGLVG
ncbi:extracellular solute-binding protein [Streptomyces sp. Li-HN-5-11]|uniref:ABC transporter substrate-binding protein n=1 Tax=Streptomyces sp. Li-HN-5-11 TaxID=3075432 RepID=UPI0028A835D5|nr:extracellular solute-binding protein [Streptomyces sp. Li-HN-5-11]WNM36282.1 extracellular solute-binding protein [Streptomyces sp. Li-HN-5-11]